MSMKQDYKDIAGKLLDHIKTGILPFWFDYTMDKKNGGFFADVGNDGTVTNPDAPKGLVQHARMLWSFSRAYEVTQDSRCREYADHALNFLLKAFLDRTRGGWFYKVTSSGEPVDDRKHLYAMSFVVYGLSRYSMAFQDKKTLSLAKETIQHMVKKCHDDKNSGFDECFTRDWKATDQIEEYGTTGRRKTMNTHIHLLEAFTEYHRASEGDGAKQLCELIDVIIDKIYSVDRKSLLLFFERGWTPLDSIISFGHDIELSWLLQEAVDVGGYRVQDAKDVAFELVDNVLLNGFSCETPDRGLLYEASPDYSKLDTASIWWVQAEGMTGFLHNYARTGRKASWDAFQKLMNWCLEGHYDSTHGEWFELAGDATRWKAGIWKTPYHNLRACVECGETLKNL